MKTYKNLIIKAMLLTPYYMLSELNGLILFLLYIILIQIISKIDNIQYYISAFTFSIYVILILLINYDEKYYIYQINHIVQMVIIITLMISSINYKEIETFLKDKTNYLIATFVFFGSIYFIGHENYVINFNMIIFILFVLFNRENSNYYFLALALLLSAIFLNERFVIILCTLMLFICTINLNRKKFNLVALLIVTAPILIALTIDDITIAKLYLFDENTAIRIEFINGAFEVLKDNWLLGNGFGNEYRPAVYNYVIPHPLLNDYDSVRIISNHNSIVDTWLKLGLIGVICLIYVLFFYKSKKEIDYIERYILLTLSIGMSFDAMLENQTQLHAAIMFIFTLFKMREFENAKI